MPPIRTSSPSRTSLFDGSLPHLFDETKSKSRRPHRRHRDPRRPRPAHQAIHEKSSVDKFIVCEETAIEGPNSVGELESDDLRSAADATAKMVTRPTDDIVELSRAAKKLGLEM